MDPIRFRCPACQQSLKVRAEKAGKKVRCNRCAKTLTVPAAEFGVETAPLPYEDEAQPRGQPTKTFTGKRTGCEREEVSEDDVPAEEDESEEPADEPRKKRKPKRKKRSELWRLPRLGLLVLMVATVLALLNVAGSQLLSHLLIRRATLSGTLEGLKVFLWIGVATLVVFSLIKLVAFGLCLFAPGDSGARPFAVLALAATMLNTAMSAYLLWMPFTGPLRIDTPDEKRLRDPKELERWLRESQERAERIQKDLRAMMLRMAVMQTLGTLLQGLYLISVPLLLRAFCRALGLVKLEPNCDGLLKIGAGIIALSIAAQLLGLVLLRFGGVVGWLGLALSVAWEGLLLVLLFQLWQAMPSPR